MNIREQSTCVMQTDELSLQFFFTNCNLDIKKIILFIKTHCILHPSAILLKKLIAGIKDLSDMFSLYLNFLLTLPKF